MKSRVSFSWIKFLLSLQDGSENGKFMHVADSNYFNVDPTPTVGKPVEIHNVRPSAIGSIPVQTLGVFNSAYSAAATSSSSSQRKVVASKKAPNAALVLSKAPRTKGAYMNLLMWWFWHEFANISCSEAELRQHFEAVILKGSNHWVKRIWGLGD